LERAAAKIRIPTGQSGPGSCTLPSPSSHSTWGGQSARPHETARQPKTSACRSNRRETWPKTSRKYRPRQIRNATTCTIAIADAPPHWARNPGHIPSDASIAPPASAITPRLPREKKPK
jgi:hypothetical protein